MKQLLPYFEAQEIALTSQARSKFSIVPKDPERDLRPLIDKIGRGVVFDVPDDTGKMIQMAGILEKVDDVVFTITAFCEILGSAKKIYIGWWNELVLDGLTITFPYVYRGFPIDIKLYGKETLCKRISPYVKSRLDQILFHFEPKEVHGELVDQEETADVE